MTALIFLSVSGGRLCNMCNVRNENARTYSPSMARCCPPLAAAHPRVSSLSLTLSHSLSFYPPFRKRSQTHILPLSPLIFPQSSPSLFPSRSPPLSTLMSFRCIRIGLRLQQPFSAGSILPPSLPPSHLPHSSLPPSLSVSRSKSPPRLFAFLVYLPLFQTHPLITGKTVAVGKL